MKDSRSRLASRGGRDDSCDEGATQPGEHLVETPRSPETPTTPGVPPETKQMVQSEVSVIAEDSDSRHEVGEERSQSKLPSPRAQSPSRIESASAPDSGVQTEAAMVIQVRRDVA